MEPKEQKEESWEEKVIVDDIHFHTHRSCIIITRVGGIISIITRVGVYQSCVNEPYVGRVPMMPKIVTLVIGNVLQRQQN